MTHHLGRRTFLKQAAVATTGFWALGGVSLAESKSPNEKLNVGFIGVGGQGGGNLGRIAGLGENVVALCDIDETNLGNAADKHSKAAKYADFRAMLEKQKDIDAVVISTPDHMHAAAGLMAMKLKKHVYCEKPLTHTVYEARLMRKTAKEMGVATSMGNHGTANDGLRRAVELVQAGVIGPVKEVHVWTNRPIWPQGMATRPKPEAVPKTVNWDLWLGVAKERPYAPGYHPFAWRGWWDFGTGALGDMACHTANMAFMACKLGYPVSVEAKSEEINPETFPSWSTITYQFPKRGDLPELKWVWYDGKKKDKDGKEQPNLPNNRLCHELRSNSGSGSLLIGDKGYLFSPNDYGADFVLGFKDDYVGFKGPEKSLPRSQGHHKDWVLACKGGASAMANFDYAAFLTEVVVLGNVALRVGKKIDWNAENMAATNCPEAAQFIKPDFRKGWDL
jgi:predicted dehydrogenase